VSFVVEIKIAMIVTYYYEIVGCEVYSFDVYLTEAPSLFFKNMNQKKPSENSDLNQNH
jgi:hypothetical protein